MDPADEVEPGQTAIRAASPDAGEGRAESEGLIAPADLTRESSAARLPTASRARDEEQEGSQDEARRRPTASRDTPQEVAPPAEEGEHPPLEEAPILTSGSVFCASSVLELTCQRELGRGGMGVVYLVRDPRLGRLAALKLLRVEPTPTRVARFRREAAITAHLDHPGIPPVYESGTSPAGRDFLLLRFVEGRSLADAMDRLEERRLRARQRGQSPDPAPRELLEALVKVGEALAYAHSRGIVHRDLKPGNVMLGHFGEVLLMDWGLARDLRESEDADMSFRAQLDLMPVDTRDGAFLGTLGYMAPEQARGEEVDARADVFALGALLCEILSGQGPFEGELTSEVLANTRAGRVRLPGQLSAQVPPELDAIAARALAPTRELRYASAADFARDLKAWLEGRRVSVFHYSPAARVLRWVRRHSTLSASLALVLMGLVLAGQARRMERVAQLKEAEAEYHRRAADLSRRAPSGFEEHLGRAWGAFSAARTWRQLDPESVEAARAQYRAALALGEVALRGRQWSMARQAYLLARGLGEDDDRVDALVARVEAAREAELSRRRATVRQVLEQVESGRRTRPDDLRDAVLEVVHQAEPGETVPELVSRLEAINAALRRVERDLLLSAVIPDRWERAAGEKVIEGLEAAIDAQAELRPGEEPWREHRRRILAAQLRLEERARREFRPLHLDTYRELLASRQRETLGSGQLDLAWVIVEVLGRMERREAVKPLLKHLRLVAEAGPAASCVRALQRLGEGQAATELAKQRFGGVPSLEAWPANLQQGELGPRQD